MENVIVNIAENLIGSSFTFIGLIFTSLGIILNIKENWKIKQLQKSDSFDRFILNNVLCVVCVLLFILVSFAIIIAKYFDIKILFWSIFVIYALLFMIVCYLIVNIVFKYYKLILLAKNDDKPILSINKDDE